MERELYHDPVLPNGVAQEGYYGGNQGGSVVSSSSKKESSYSSSSSVVPKQTVSYQAVSGNSGQSSGTTYTSLPETGSSYTVTSGKVVPTLYTVGSSGTIHFPSEEEHDQAKSSSYSSSSSYSKASNVHRGSVVVPGAVPIANNDDFEKRSNKVFDLVSGYGTFLPAKEVSVQQPSSSSGSVVSSSYSSSAHTSNSEGYKPVLVETGYSGSQNGYQGAIGTGSKSSSVYNSKSTAIPTHIAPGMPLGDPITPPEVSGSYFNGEKHYSSSSSHSDGYKTSGYTGGYSDAGQGYGSSGYGARDQTVGGYRSTSGYGTNSGYGVSSSYGGRGYGVGSGYSASGYGDNSQITQTHISGYGAPADETGRLIVGSDLCKFNCDDVSLQNLGATGGVKKYGISSSWSSKSQTVNGKTTESKQASVTVNDNGKVDTYSTHN